MTTTSRKLSALAALYLAAASPRTTKATAAFVSTTRLSGLTTSTATSSRPSPNRLFALIYGAPEDAPHHPSNDASYNYNEWHHQPSTTSSYSAYSTTSSSSSSSSISNTEQPEKFSQVLHLLAEPDRVAPLARLAAAFSPAERQLSLSDIQQVHVVSVDEHGMDLAAMVCEDSGCVSLNVPVAFPKACLEEHGSSSPQEFQDCVVHNLGELNTRAGVVLEQTAWKERNAHVVQELQGAMAEGSVGVAIAALPPWWLAPDEAVNTAGAAPDLPTECDTLLRLLNEDEFSQEVTCLTAHALDEAGNVEAATSVQRAAVIAVGPAGLVMRAAVQSLAAEVRILQVPLSFAQPALTASTLRNAVLSLIESLA